MANLFDYLDWYGGFDFQTVPFNEVDNLVLAQLSYMKLDEAIGSDDMVPTYEAQARFLQAHGLERPSGNEKRQAELMRLGEAVATPGVQLPDNGPLISERTNDLLDYLATSGKRYRDARVGYYESVLDEDTHEQFAALTVLLPDGTVYVSYRGTDDSIVGWVEDCEISYRIIPSQKHALRYLRRVANKTVGPLRIGGHSKGGNLAAYAAAMAPELDNRIIDVWCNDSPGFEDEVVPLSSFDRLLGRTHIFTPEYSVVGAIMEHALEPTIIKSAGDGVMEHSEVDWQVMRGSIVRGSEQRTGSINVNRAFNDLLASRDLEGREKFINELYQSCLDHGLHTVSDMMGSGAAGLRAVTDSINSLDEGDRDTMYNFIWSAMGGAMRGAAADATASTAAALAPVAKAVNEAVTTAMAKVETGAKELIKKTADPKTVEFLVDLRDRTQERLAAAGSSETASPDETAASDASGQGSLPSAQSDTPAAKGDAEQPR
ncbi:MAG: Mbeg1-like protein [Olegusella sp.]|nr:Mbeg1-like protein [Olegusella sp.]